MTEKLNEKVSPDTGSTKEKRKCKYCWYDRYFSTQEIVIHENHCWSHRKKKEELKYFVVELMTAMQWGSRSPNWKYPYKEYIRCVYKLEVIFCDTEEELDRIIKEAYFQHYKVIYSHLDTLVYRKEVRRFKWGQSTSRWEKVYLNHPDIIPKKWIDRDNEYHIRSWINEDLKRIVTKNAWKNYVLWADPHCVRLDQFGVIYHWNKEEHIIDIALNRSSN